MEEIINYSGYLCKQATYTYVRTYVRILSECMAMHV